MGVQDRDWYHEAQKERERKTARFGGGSNHSVVSRANNGHL